MSAYLDTHPLRDAFVANQLERLAELIVKQGEALLEDADVEVPSRVVSAVMLIGERGQISAADIADALDQPHQLVTQRIELLIETGVVDRIADPQDGRRKILQLTDKGAVQFDRLVRRLRKADAIFAALFKEISCDLSTICEHATERLGQRSLLERMQSI